MKFVGKAVQACGKVAGRLHLGLRGQILLLGVAGVVVVGAIYLAGLQVEQRSQHEADRFGALEGLTAKVSENLLQARETATQFMQKPTDKKVALARGDGDRRRSPGSPRSKPSPRNCRTAIRCARRCPFAR